jgi:polysaccharide export outer membrane protein
MNIPGIGTRFSTGVAVIVMAMLGCLSVLTQADAATPTADQLELFQQLPAAQQHELLKSLGDKSAVKKVAPLEMPVVVTPLENASRDAQWASNTQKKDSVVESGNIKAQPASQNKPLLPFGYDLFAGAPTTFSPVTEIPIPVDYVIGPGDTVQVQLIGKENAEYELMVDRDGQLQFPGIGPIAVTGMRFVELKQALARRINKKMLGVTPYVSLGALRSMRVFLMGDVNRPGSYMVSALSTMTNALFVSGGVKTIGSLRDIQLKRRGKVVQHFDLYDLLLKGDTSKDVRIQPGDVIFVPPVGATAGVAGEVRRPAVYEIKQEKTISELVEMAGGLLPTAYSPASQLQRINAQGERVLVNVDLSSELESARQIKDGDRLRIFSVFDKMEDVVFVSGHVRRPGGLQWFKGMHLSDAISNVAQLLPEPGLRFVLVRRERPSDRSLEVLVSRLDTVFANPDSTDNLALLPQDRIFVFGLTDEAVEFRNSILSELVMELRQQVSQDQPELVVDVEGNVTWPGEYPLSTQMTLLDLLRVAGDVAPNTDMHYVLVMRENAEVTTITARSFDLVNTGDADSAKAFLLSPRDKIFVFEEQSDRSALLSSSMEKLKQQASVKAPALVTSITGLVRSSGEYPLESGMTVTDLIRAAGGLTESAYSLEAEISRYEIESEQVRETQHLQVNLEKVFSGDESSNIELKPHDSLQIKRLPFWAERRVVELRGEVRFPGYYPVSRNETLLEVLKRAGGLTDQAFAEGAILVRESLRKKEQEQLDSLRLRLESDLAAVDLEKAQANTEQQRSVGMASSLLNQLRTTKALGRLVINLPEMLAADADADAESRAGEARDVLLRDGDKLLIPPVTQEVTIIGEVQHATSHLFTPDLTVSDYINKSGGLTYRADEDRIYVVRANGEVLPSHAADWFSGNLYVRPGDTIVVPLDAERMKPLTLWTSVSQIIYQIGIAAASWNAVGIF